MNTKTIIFPVLLLLLKTQDIIFIFFTNLPLIIFKHIMIIFTRKELKKCLNFSNNNIFKRIWEYKQPGPYLCHKTQSPQGGYP